MMNQKTISWFEEAFVRAGNKAQEALVGLVDGMYDGLPHTQLEEIRDSFVSALEEISIYDIAYKLATEDNKSYPDYEKLRSHVETIISKLNKRMRGE